MKLDQLRQIIREEVRAAVKDELQDMLNEAVKYASAPTSEKTSVVEKQMYKPVTQKDLKRTWSTGPLNKGTIPLEEMLAATKQSMSREDFQNVMGSGPAVSAPNFASQAAAKMGMTEGPLPGIDITKLPFMNKAKAVLDASIAYDKKRLG